MADGLESPRLALEAEAQLEDPPLPLGKRIERTPEFNDAMALRQARALCQV